MLLFATRRFYYDSYKNIIHIAHLYPLTELKHEKCLKASKQNELLLLVKFRLQETSRIASSEKVRGFGF